MATASQKAEFYRVYGPIVEEQCRGTGLYPEVILAQLAVESDYGVSPAAHGNLGGRKVTERTKRNGVEGKDYEIKRAYEDFTTQEAADAFAKQQKDLGYKVYSIKEEEKGRYVVRVDQPFEAGGDGSPEDNVRGQIAFLQRNKRYTRNGVFDADNPEDQARAIKKAGYATSAGYAQTLIDVYSQDDFPELSSGPAYQVTQEEAERVYGPSAKINNVNGKDVITYTDDFGDSQQVDLNTVTEESPDYEPMPMLGEVEVKPQPERVSPITPDTEERQDNTRVVTPPVADDDNLIVNESDADRRKREKLQEEDERRNLRAREREEDAKRYMELTRKKKEAVEYYGKEGRRAKRFDEELAEIEKKYNLTPMRSDEDLEKIRLETINQILDDPEERDNVSTDQDLVDIGEEESNVEDNFYVEKPEGLGNRRYFYKDNNTYQIDDEGNVKKTEEGYSPEVPENAQPGDYFRDGDYIYKLLPNGEIVFANSEEDDLKNAVIINASENENVETITDTREPTVEEIETRHGPNASINDLNGVPHVVYTDENGDPKQYPVSEFYNEENTQRYELYDNGTLPPLQNTPITDDDLIARQDNTRVDPSFIPNEQTSLVTSANDIDNDGVPDLLDPDSQTVEVVDTDFANINNNQNNNQTNYLDTLGDLGKTLSQGLGLVQDVRDMIGNPDDLMMSALGKKAYAEAMKEIKPADYPELSAQFKDHLNQTRQLAKMGFSLDESQKIKSDIDAAYGKGIENAVRGTAGDRAKFLAMSGVLDSQRQSALLDFAAKDAALQRQNQGQYLKALSFSEEYELNKTKAERAEELQLTLQQKKGASEFAKTVFAQISQNNANKRLAPVLNRYKNELLSGMSGGGSPYSLTTPNITGIN